MIQSFLSARENCYKVVTGLLEAEVSLRAGSSKLVNGDFEEGGYNLFKIVSQGEAFHKQRLNVASESFIARVESALRPKNTR